MALLILLSFFTGCGLATGFGVDAGPSSEFTWTAPNPAIASPKAMPSPVPAATPPAGGSLTDMGATVHRDNLDLGFQQDKPNDEQHNGADISAQFVALNTRQAVKEETAAKRSRIPRHVEHVNDQDFEQKVVSSNETVLVDFYADWCGPCKMLAPVLDELAQETPDTRIVKVNIDRSPKLAEHYGVRSVPTLILFKDGKPVTRRKGLNSKASLKALIAK
jgi:thioredoxin 1